MGRISTVEWVMIVPQCIGALAGFLNEIKAAKDDDGKVSMNEFMDALSTLTTALADIFGPALKD